MAGSLAAVYRLGPQSRVSALMLEPGSCLLVSQQISITAHPQQAPQLGSSLLAFAVIIGPVLLLLLLVLCGDIAAADAGSAAWFPRCPLHYLPHRAAVVRSVLTVGAH